jgi:hypothetical protein
MIPKHRVEVIDREYAAILSVKTPAERVAMGDSCHRAARILVRSRIEELQPMWSDEEKQQEFLRRILGDGATRYLASRG